MLDFRSDFELDFRLKEKDRSTFVRFARKVFKSYSGERRKNRRNLTDPN